MESASRGSIGQGGECCGSRWAPSCQEEPCFWQFRAGGCRRGPVHRQKFKDHLGVTVFTDHLGIAGFTNQGDIVCKFFAAYSYLTVFRRCQRDLLRIHELLKGSRGWMQQDGEVQRSPFPEIARRRKDFQLRGAYYDQQRGEGCEDQ